MPETLLSFSEVLLFGRIVEDLQIPSQVEGLKAKVATTDNVDALKGTGPVDGVNVASGDVVLVRAQTDAKQNGLYIVDSDSTKNWHQSKVGKGIVVAVEEGNTFAGTLWEQKMPLNSSKQEFKQTNNKKKKRGRGQNKFVEEQLFDDDARFARIYGFSFEGTYYELPSPTLFLVHGDGKSAIGSGSTSNPIPDDHAARAPLDPSVTGVAAADYQISDDIRVWNYDKADYTIRMDVATGMIEQVLLDVFFEFDAPAIAGAKVSGAKVSGAKVSGAKVSGAKVSGAKVSGAKARGPGD